MSSPTHPESIERGRTLRSRSIALRLLAAYIFLLPFQFTYYLSADDFMRLGLSDFALFILFVLFVGELRIVKSAWTVWHTSLLFLMPVSAIVVSIVLEPVSMSVLFAKVIGMSILFVLFLAITTFVETVADVRRLLSVLVKVIVAQNIVATGLYLVRANVPLINGDGSRLSGMLPDPNAYGSLLVITSAMLLATMASPSPLLSRRASRLAVVTLPLSIVLTSSRTTWVAFAVVLLIYAVARPGAAAKYILAVGFGLVVVAVFVAPSLTEQQIVLGTRGTGGRVELAEAMIDAFWRSPVVGIGIGRFFQEQGVIIHNTVGWFLGEFGLVGLTVIGGVLLTTAMRVRRVYQRSDEPARSLALALGLAFAGMCVVSLGIEALYQRWWWVIMALISTMYAKLPSAAVDRPVATRLPS